MQEYTDPLTIVVNGSQRVMLIAPTLYEDLIDVNDVAIAPTLSLQTPGVDSAKPVCWQTTE